MPRNNENQPPIEVSSSYSLLPRRAETSIYLNETEQGRLRSLINGINDNPNWWEIALGVFASAALSFGVTYFFLLPENTPEDARRWVFGIALTTVCLTIVSVFAVFSQKKTKSQSKQAVLDEFDRIKDQFQPFTEEEAPESPDSYLPRFSIVAAKYGTSDNSIDITERLANLVMGNRLETVASNETAGSDPAPGIVKELEIEYRVGAETAIRRFREGDRMVLPE